MAEIIDPDEIDFSFYEHETDAQQKVKDASVYIQELIDRIHTPVAPIHVLMPWRKTHNFVQFRPGEVTIWGGMSGAGKSLVTGQVALSLCAQGQKTCIASFEMKPLKTLERMGRQFSGENPGDPTWLHIPDSRAALISLYEEFKDWTDNRLWLYDQQGTVTVRQVCAVIRYCVKEKKVTQFFVDSLMKCVAGEDDLNGQKAFIDEICAIARDHNIHVHIIHHVRKPKDDKAKPGKYDYKGSGAITDQVDNVITVWRNKEKERKIESGEQVDQTKDPDAILICDKQRNGEWEGSIALWFHAISQQFVANYNDEPLKLYSPDS